MEIGNQKRHMLIILLIVFLAFMSSMTSVAIAQETLYSIDETRITTDGKAILPDIYADKIAYIVYHDNGYLGDIYLYDLSTQKETQVATGTGSSVDICGGKIVWTFDNNGEHNIYMYDFSTSQVTQITNDGKSCYPRIYGDIIVYEVEYQSTSTYSDIYMYDISTSQKTQLTSHEIAISPHIYGDKIVWCQNYDIYMYDVSTSQKIQITSGGMVSGIDIYGDKIVWTGGQNVIHLYDLSTSDDVIITSTNYSSVPAIYKDRVVWSDYHDSHGSDDIFMYNISTGQKTQITTNGHSRDPNIFGNRIVYRNYGGTVGFGTDVYMSEITGEIIDSTFKPYPYGYNFENDNVETEYSWDQFCRTYDYEGPQYSATVFLDDNQPFQVATKEFTFYQNYFKDLGKEAVCAGMSASSIVLYSHGLNVWDYDKLDSIPESWTLYGPFVEDYYPQTIQEWIGYYHTLQFDKACFQERSADVSLSEVYNNLKQNLKSDWTQNPMTLRFSLDKMDGKSSGHRVVPYKILETMDHKTGYIYIYDPNHPYDRDNEDDSIRYITIDLENWKADDYGSWTNLRDFRLISLNAINEDPQIPDSLIDLNDKDNAHLLITDNEGRHLGYYRGEFKEEIPRAFKVITEGEVATDSMLESYYVPDESLKKELYGVNNDVSTISMYTPKGIIVADVAVYPGSVDEFKVINSGIGTEFKSGSGTASLSLMVNVKNEDSVQIVRADISQIEESCIIDLSNSEGVVSIHNQGSPKTFNLYLAQIVNTGSVGDSIENVVLEEDSTIIIKPLNWNDIANTEILIEHDFGSDGTIDSTDTIRPDNDQLLLVANAGDDKTANEGEVLTFSGSYDSTGTDDTPLIKWDFVDGETASGTLSPTHTYADNGEYTVTLTVTDDDGGIGTDTLIATVNNVEPVLDTIVAPIDPCKVNTPVAVSSTYTDAGILDTHTAVWDFGDGTTSAGIVTETNGAGTVTGEHTYTKAGIYRVALTVTDDDGGTVSKTSESYVVVYDSTGGFVTGGGWINSPAGAVPDTTLAGKATFTLESKYKKGATVPTDNTNFQFKVANLNFKSTSCDWLVISGAQAIYQGTGTINGAGEYGFMLSAVDGAIKGDNIDRFRIKIWDKATDAIVYDNQMDAPEDAEPTTAIGGGSIVVHKVK